MLDELALANLGIIESAHIEPGRGLVVVTGETGTGKTLLLGALRLLIGGTARKDQIGPHGDEMRVEGRFVFDGEEQVAARRITEGRSRAYHDGSMVPSRVLAERLGRRVEIVGQHDALSLAESAVVRRMLDDAGGSELQAAREAYGLAYAHHRELLERQASLGGDHRSLEREVEMLVYQADEIDAAGFETGDDEDLANRAARLRNLGALAEAISGSLDDLESDGAAIDRLGSAADGLLRAGRLDTTLEPLGDEISNLVDAAGALAGELRRYVEDLEHDGEGLDEVERRLGLLSALRRKYGDSLDAILAYAERARARADEVSELLAGAATLTEEIEKAADAVATAGATLGEIRRIVAGEVARRARGHLVDLGFSDPVVQFEFVPSAPGPHGVDRITVHFASDASLSPGPVSRIASGGELSRLVLSVRLATGAGDAPVLAFDEIDAGVGGATAYEMGAKLAMLASERQVLVVTHLPQIAAYADRHFVVDRDGSNASVRLVDGDHRLTELSRMLSGLEGSASGRNHAEELLATAQTRRRG